jgi:hypothetical protein
MATVPVEVWIGLTLILSAGVLYALARWSRDHYVRKGATPDEIAELHRPLRPPDKFTTREDRKRERDQFGEYLRAKYSPANLTILSFLPPIILCGLGLPVLAWGVLKWVLRSFL